MGIVTKTRRRRRRIAIAGEPMWHGAKAADLRSTAAYMQVPLTSMLGLADRRHLLGEGWNRR
jgi:hypothetical protein